MVGKPVGIQFAAPGARRAPLICQHHRVEILLIVNATASSVTARIRVVIQKALSADHHVTLAETSRRGHASRLAQSAAAAGTGAVVVLGGDGTLNEAANGLVGTDTALGVLPGGSTNVFARTIGLPNDPVESVGVLLEALDRRSIRRIGLGSVNGRYFLFHAGLGFDAAVVAQVERRSTLKRWAGHPLFAYATLTTWLRHYDHSHPRLQLRFPDGTVVDDGYFTIVLNTDPYTYLGNRPLHASPATGLDDALGVVTLRSLRLPTVVRVLAATLGSGQALARNPMVDRRTGVTSLHVEGIGPFPYQVDGDHLGEVTSLDVAYEAGVLALVVPVPD